ncbi:hypothetical protein LTR56_023615 [Elasticomyces elasticus]|nr:hypothetical protein LTR56_023615 [Elasticomyces elasticus]KAK3624836.1 hypothetical protein LTR22_023810 [Elasticomyces elasticus]KAK4906533.1 hypothetical protein LTR49_024339 [Elasticomyces elasticus]KAK5756802.1 hypothetical protein LTS12_013135 [Elasticomyces elasticus]
MNLDPSSGRRSTSPASSGRASPVPRAERRAVEDDLYRADKGLRRYGALIERAINTWETAPQEWADYIAFLARLLKALQSHPKDAPVLPHTDAVAYKLAQCLNPALPSGVHQKALEVYTYIFHTFGLDHLSGHLHDYLPGLAPVLTFASLSVRPALYLLFEHYIMKISVNDLRSATKALILSLLPALEEETGEDFGRAFAILDSLHDKYASENASEAHTGFFWQTLFLCVVTSPSRRQGALNFLTRKLPKFVSSGGQKQATGAEDSGTGLDALSDGVRDVVTPEPGLLVRCFAAGLRDSNALVQRGFLELLVTHLPLNSPVLMGGVEARDLDLLMSAASSILLRRDMGLNRRLWSWLLGPETKPAISPSPASSPSEERHSLGTSSSASQRQYFNEYAKASLLRSVLTMFTSGDLTAASRSRPYRICLSLLDRWEIGGAIASDVFLPAMQSMYAFSKTGLPAIVAEVQRSASAFFDGMESRVIWAVINGKLQSSMVPQRVDIESLAMLIWVFETFNTQDEEMVTVHIPLSTLDVLNRLQNLAGDADETRILELASALVGLVPQRASGKMNTLAQSELCTTDGREPLLHAIADFYDHVRQGDANAPLPSDGTTARAIIVGLATDLTVEALHIRSRNIQGMIDLLFEIRARWPESSPSQNSRVECAIVRYLGRSQAAPKKLALPMLSSFTAYLTAGTSRVDTTHATATPWVPSIVACLWTHLSPSSPKYHVEATRLLWQLEVSTNAEDAFEVVLLDLMRPVNDATHASADLPLTREETVRRFEVLWNHSVPLQAPLVGHGQSRRGSSLAGGDDPARVAHRIEVMSDSLFRVIDLMREPSSLASEVTKTWLSSLPSLDSVVGLLLARLQALRDTYHDQRQDTEASKRDERETVRDIEYVLSNFDGLLSNGSTWVWTCIAAVDVDNDQDDSHKGITALGTHCIQLLNDQQTSAKQLHRTVISLLQILIDGPAAIELKHLRIDEAVLIRMATCLREEDTALQSSLLRLITAAIRLRVRDEDQAPLGEPRRRSSLTTRQKSTTIAREGGNSSALSMMGPPPQLMQILRMAFASQAARLYLDQWVSFLSTILPTFASAIFTSLLPLVETLCTQTKGLFAELVTMTGTHGSSSVFAPDTAILHLLDALEVTLARAHECLLVEGVSDETTRPQAQANGFLSSVTSGVFKAQGPPSKTAHANSRLTVVLAFQDTIRACLDIWAWTNSFSIGNQYDRSSSATTAHNAQRLRNKTRALLEQMFAVETLESLEILISYWQSEQQLEPAASVLNLVQTMQRPKDILPVILDVLCGRITPAALPSTRQSSQTTDLTATEVALFLLAYIQITDDDALDEVWAETITFLKDVLTNPLPYRHIMPVLLALVHLLSQKLVNTNYGEQRQMRRELAETYQKLLAALFTTMSSGVFAETQESPRHAHANPAVAMVSMDALSVLHRAVEDLDTILDSPDRVTAVITNIQNSVLSPMIHGKTFPRGMSPEHLNLQLAITRKAPMSKTWKKDVSDALNDPRLFTSSHDLMQSHWLPIIHQWAARDKDRMPELLARLTSPTTAGIMFGVGANAARLEADRRTQLNLRRVCLLLLASPIDTWITHLRDYDEKLIELFGATASSSPSSVIKADLCMLCRALTLSLGATHLSPLWPTMNGNLQAALTSMLEHKQNHASFTNLGLLQACKLLDQLVLLSPDEFQLHEWLYIADTVDAVYRPSEYTATALADQVAEVLGSSDLDNQPALEISASHDTNERRHLVFGLGSMETDDLRAMDREDFVRVVLRPFLTQLSINAYEDTYSMEPPVIDHSCRDLLRDLMELSTVVT